MNAVEIEEAITELAGQPFDSENFPYSFLECFGNKAVAIQRLRTGNTNKSDLKGGVLQRNHIHIVVCNEGDVNKAFVDLKLSKATAKGKVNFILATDGVEFEAEDLASGETVACDYEKFADHFGFFLPLAGITTIKQIRNNPIDIQATSRLNKLYVQLLKDNADWGTAGRRHDMNQFMARLIFCFFAEDTDIFKGTDLFTTTVEQMSDSRSDNTHEIISEIFRAMDINNADRAASGIPRWAAAFPYVNGGLFTENVEVPRFSRIARKYLLHAGSLDWQQINPDIFGSMIQAVADDEERGSLGMHYTSVENILKLLNPLFLDDLRKQLEEAGGSPVKLLNLRKRLAKIRVFDPACGSGNFLVIAYKQMREIEFEINKRRNETHLKSDVPLKNFRGIELNDFPVAIARLSLIIAEYQCDLVYRGQKDALAEFLPLDSMNWITCGNALRLDWLSVCQPTGRIVKLRGNDLLSTPHDQEEIDFSNEGGEVFICGNPPFLGTKYQSKENKADLKGVFSRYNKSFGNIDYVGGWIELACRYSRTVDLTAFAFVSTSSLFEGEQAEILLQIMENYGQSISWAHRAFKWANNATNNAGVSCCIVGFNEKKDNSRCFIFEDETRREVSNIGPYLVNMPNVVAKKTNKSISGLSVMSFGSMSNDNGFFTYSEEDYQNLILQEPEIQMYFKKAIGGAEFIKGLQRRIIYINDPSQLSVHHRLLLKETFDLVSNYRGESKREATRKLAKKPECFAEDRHKEGSRIFVPQILSEKREFIPAGFFRTGSIVIAPHMEILEGALYEFAIISSRAHLVWLSTVCGKLETRYRYSNSLVWHTFPAPKLTEKNKIDLNKCAEDILLAREAHFPATIADLYNPEAMPENLRLAHERNDEVLERIYIGRRFKNDTERLEKLFDLYTKMTSPEAMISAKGAQR